MERRDFVNDDLRLIQDTEGLTFGTDALLLAGYINGKYSLGCEFGSGTGIITMLLVSRKKLSRAVAVEVQEDYARLTERNLEINSLSDRVEVVHSDVRDFRYKEEFDLIYSNPPYMKTDSGKKNLLDKKNIARHEVFGGIYDFCLAARKNLKFGGKFAAVYRCDRLIDLIDAMRKSDIEPKRITLVHADPKSEPSMALVEGKAGAKASLLVTRPLIIYADREHKRYSEDMNFIMENGSFPSDFKR